ncbi:hypothetical protein J2Y38_002133 [Flavobacterium sp. 2755]|uniref:ThiF family adenylyltransferase n=1 Tax=Flavobacterium sp. 2755 TaxID=2817765 RepID=UPI00286553C1|nr:ThiF family adenylyltransferase [Flavobacterium sp. 2755]MDR6761922.1 hypothetical protein [Flavobacterium sp. 2755]
MLFSNDMALYDGVLRSEVEEGISEIRKYVGADSLKIFSLDSDYIAVGASYDVSLPSRGSADNLIRVEEPILVRLSLENYPEQAPAILSDRKDFPKTNLPHLYYTPKDKPAVLCLVRDSLNQWFASITMQDFLLVGSQWFYKAAIGRLLDDNDEFDPVRLEKNISGKHIYKYETFEEIVKNDQRLIPDFPMALILSCLYKSDSKKQFVYKSIAGIPLLGLTDITKTVSTALKLIRSSENKIKVNSLFSLLVWDPEQTEEKYYSTNLPQNYGELKSYLSLRGINIAAMLAAVKTAKVEISKLIPIVHAVRRPKKLIGYPGTYEFFTYTLLIPDQGLEALTDISPVLMKSHTEPYSSKLAQVLSNENRNQKTLFIGAGSLGSKMLLHEARAGNVNIGAVDHDKFEQHNLARHSLFSGSIGQNKASAVIEEVKEFYELDVTSGFHAYEHSITFFNDEVFRKYDIIVDTTASQQVLQHFVLRDLPESVQYNRCELVDDGQTGLLYIEGVKRNPRIDDLSFTACYLASRDSDLHIWRRNDATREPTVLNIGLGCNSVTTVMSDDLISFHAAAFSQVLGSAGYLKQEDSGLLYLSVSRKANGIPQISSRQFPIKPFDVFECEAGSGWSIRFFPGVCQDLRKMSEKAGKLETGGVLIGVANYKTKVIHVFEASGEPEGSYGTVVAFTRGIIGLPEFIDQIKYNTGEIIGYIGEWHSHPMNLERLSGQDLETIEKLKEINRRTPIPTCAVIVTPHRIIPFVYD